MATLPALSVEARPLKASDLVGIWAYESAYTEFPDGRRINQFGEHPQGLFIIRPNGWYSHIVMADDLPNVASGLLKEMTPTEAEAIAEGVLAHFGTYTVNEARGTFTVTILKSSFPNFDGVTQERTVLDLTHNRLEYVNPVSSAGDDAKVYAVLRRVN
ncbi:MAG TPA: lipocalin-like domain-containing protein [Candidatus Saccharimonadales bacterium]|nr:lipocalin-like domain-containing protein [Candidatus Saccharimonadales bacterium]